MFRYALFGYTGYTSISNEMIAHDIKLKTTMEMSSNSHQTSDRANPAQPSSSTVPMFPHPQAEPLTAIPATRDGVFPTTICGPPLPKPSTKSPLTPQLSVTTMKNSIGIAAPGPSVDSITGPQPINPIVVPMAVYKDHTLCPKCNNILSKVNMRRHLIRCGNQRAATEAQQPCPSCSKLITISHMSRHLKTCDPACLKRKLDESAITTPKTPRLNTNVQPSSHRDTKVKPTSRTCTDTDLRPALCDTPKPCPGPITHRPSSGNPTSHISASIKDVIEIETAFKGRMKTYLLENHLNRKDPITFLTSVRDLVERKINEAVSERNIKVNLVLLAEYKKPINNSLEFKEMNFKTKNFAILPSTNIAEYIGNAEKKILAEMEEFQGKGSGWTLNRVFSLEVRVNKYLPLRGSSFIDLPAQIKAKRAVLNVVNNDQKCFLWSILAALHPVETNPSRIKHYQPFEHELDQYLEGISFPVSLDQVKLFERHSGISINVYAYDDKCVVYPLHVTIEEKGRHVDLLHVKDHGNSHYCLITDLSRLISSQLSKRGHKIWLCKRCLLHFGTEALLQSHKEYCQEHEPVRIEMPKEGDIVKFKDFQNCMKVPFAAYADFECMLTPIETLLTQYTEPIKSYTRKYQKHDAVSFSYYITYSDGDYKEPVNYFGTDAAEVFVQSLIQESKNIFWLYSKEAALPMQMTQSDLEVFEYADQCHICGKDFDEENFKVRDHDHLSGRFRGAAHNSCNLNFRKPKFLPIFIHNLSGYDSHLFIKMFGLNKETINVIPSNEERYISYTVNVEGGVKLRFLDSMRFMAGSLDSLVNNLTPQQFHHISKYYSGDKLQLLLRKGVYPYDFMDNIAKFTSTSLPSKTDFYNTLNMSEITDEDYQHAINVWDTFEIADMKQYTTLYNQTDVLLLADVMENFRDVCLQTYKLDPAWHFTAPGLAWNAMLKTTGIELDLLTDYDMVLMIGKGIRGGVSQCSNRYAKANNPYMETFNSEEPISYLTYLDANNLYGWAMSQSMPYANFKWEEDFNTDITQVPDDSPTGYILEVDLDYPKELHNSHSDLPLAPERRTPPGSTQKKLLTTLFDKTKYVLHYRNLKLYLSLGMRLKKIHRVISFSQKDWLKTYIDLNTNLRTNAKNDFEKDFFKLMNNSVFGKTMENIRNRVNIRLITKEEQADKLMAKPNFKHRTIFTETLAAVHMSKTKLFFNKPIFVGMSILDVSKILMYDFHYNVIKRKYGDDAQLQYKDTDSLTYLIKTKNWYNDMKTMIDLYDTSDYPCPNRYSMPQVNKKVLGKMKDELNGRIMYEHIGLRSNMYASKSERSLKTDGVIKRSKGVKKSVIKKDLTFEDYRECLLNREQTYRKMNLIRSYRHNLHSVEMHKISLSAQDDKRYVMEDGITTLPWGHHAIPKDDTTVPMVE